MFNKANMISRDTTIKWRQMTKGPKRELSSNSVSLYKIKEFFLESLFLKFEIGIFRLKLETYKNENLFDEIFDDFLSLM